MPVDSKPTPDGNIKLIHQGAYRLPLAEVHSVKVDGIEYYKSHFVTCPNANNHRKKRVP